MMRRGAGNTDWEGVIEDDNGFDDNDVTETELVAVERTEEPEVEADGTEELSVLIVAEAEVGVAEVLQNLMVSHEKIDISTTEMKHQEATRPVI